METLAVWHSVTLDWQTFNSWLLLCGSFIVSADSAFGCSALVCCVSDGLSEGLREGRQHSILPDPKASRNRASGVQTGV